VFGLLVGPPMNLATSASQKFARSSSSKCFRSLPSTRHVSSSSLPRPYRFHVGASWAGKPPDPKDGRGKLKSSSFSADSPIGAWRDHVLSRPKGTAGTHIGEDFYYVQEMRNQSGTSLGIADGVGGWTESGVDPSLFSQALMYHAHRYSKTAWPGEPEIDPTQDYEEREVVEGWELTPVQCLELAHGGVLRERAVVAGSSTACIVNLNASNGHLRAANLGDSGFAIIRSSTIIHQQYPQTHYFNCPKQLAKFPAAHARKYATSCSDSPREADLFETKVLDGDIVILYTDGLSDNVFSTELASICSLVSRQFAMSPPTLNQPIRGGGTVQFQHLEDLQVQAMADRIVEYAQLCMINSQRVSPFEREALRAGLDFRGGKLDDVTVVVAMVRETL